MLFKARIGAVIAIVIATAVAFILVTPDPTDDVDGIVHSGKRVHAQMHSLDFVHYSTLITQTGKILHVKLTPNITPNLIDLLCSCRC